MPICFVQRRKEIRVIVAAPVGGRGGADFYASFQSNPTNVMYFSLTILHPQLHEFSSSVNKVNKVA